MKTKALFWLFCLAALPMLGQKGHNFTLKITGANRALGLLAYRFGNSQYVIDSAKAGPNGTYVFTGDEPYKAGMYVFAYSNDNSFIEFLLDFNDQHFTIETDTIEPLKHIKVTGSPANKLFFDYAHYAFKKQDEADLYRKRYRTYAANPDSAAKYSKLFDKVDVDLAKYQEKIVKEQPTSFLATIFNADWEPPMPTIPKGIIDTTAYIYNNFKKHYWDHFPFSDPRITRTLYLYGKVTEYLEKVIAPQADTVLAAATMICYRLKNNNEAYETVVTELLNHYAADERMGFDKVYVGLVDEFCIKNKPYWINPDQLKLIINKADEMRTLLVGNPAPPLNLPDTNGVNISLASVNAKYTLVFFYDPDCSHCQDEMPKLLDYYNRVKNQGVAVYCVAGGDNKQLWKDFVRKYNLPWINVYDADRQRKPYRVEYFPELVVLDKDKKVITKRVDLSRVIPYLQEQFGITP